MSTTTPKATEYTETEIAAICDEYDVDTTAGIGAYLTGTLCSAGWDVQSAQRRIVHATVTVQQHAEKVIDELQRNYRPGSVEWVQHSANKMAEAFGDWQAAVTKIAETCHALSMLAADEVMQTELRSTLRTLCFGE